MQFAVHKGQELQFTLSMNHRLLRFVDFYDEHRVMYRKKCLIKFLL